MRQDGAWTPDATVAVRRFVDARRRGDTPFDVVVPGESEPGESGAARVEEQERAGAAWWVEAIHPWRFGWTESRPWPADEMRARIAAGL